MPLESTITLRDAVSILWDAVVIGAGPAGSLAACGLARRDSRVLLVDKARFPRTKVCGCCLNGIALDALAGAGLGGLPEQLGARPLRQWRLCTRAGQAVCRLTAGSSLSRESLDHALVEQAIQCGAALLDETQAAVAVPPAPGAMHLSVSLRPRRNERKDAAQAMLRARTVIAADGLAGQSLHAWPQFRTTISRRPRLGASAILPDGPDIYEDGTVVMACGPGGYVGLVRLEDGSLDVAAALDRTAVRQAGNPAALAREILVQARLPIPPELTTVAWRCTPGLTRRRDAVGLDRVFVVGDAAGYTEPFTGEGLAWAMRSGIAVASLACQAAEHWSPSLASRWQRTHQDLVGHAHRRSRLIARILRSRFGADLLVRALRTAPCVAAPVIRVMHEPRRAATSIRMI